MGIPRLQLCELEDQPWFPVVVRDLATDYLRFMEQRFKLHLHALPILSRALRESGADRIVDLCSGGGGPVLELARELREARMPVRFTLTDRYPNLEAFAELREASGGTVDFVPTPVDARAVPPDLPGLRTFFNAFHHFGPREARGILQAATASGQPIAVLEIPERSILTILPLLFTPLYVWLATPFIKPLTLKRLLFTYLLPAVPLTCLWDGIVSQLRAYRPEELEALADGVMTHGFVWEVGTHKVPGVPGRLTYLLGRSAGEPSPSAPRTPQN